MRRKPDLIDAWLEEWASWRYHTLVLDYSTGNSLICHFGRSGIVNHRPLWLGPHSSRKVLALNNDLLDLLTSSQVAMLVVIYATAGPLYQKARQLQKTVSSLQWLCQKARRITLNQLTAEISDSEHYRHRSRKSSCAQG